MMKVENNLINFEIEEVSISKIVKDESIYPRSSIDSILVNEYTALISNGVELDPVVLCELESQLYACDGVHRICAYEKIGRRKIKARIIPVKNRSEILLYSIKLNWKHGKRLDFKYAIEKLYKFLRNEMTPQEAIKYIADKLNLSDKWIRKLLETIREKEKKEIKDKILELKSKGLNRYEIAKNIAEEYNFPLSPSSIDRIIKKEIKSKLSSKIMPKVRKIERKEVKNGEKKSVGVEEAMVEKSGESSKISLNFLTLPEAIDVLKKNKICKVSLLGCSIESVDGKVIADKQGFLELLSDYLNILRLYAKEYLEKQLLQAEELEKALNSYNLLRKLARETKNKDLKTLFSALLGSDESEVKKALQKHPLKPLEKIASEIRNYDRVSNLGHIIEVKIGKERFSWLEVLARAIENNVSGGVYRAMHYLDKIISKLLYDFENEVQKRVKEEIEKYFSPSSYP